MLIEGTGKKNNKIKGEIKFMAKTKSTLKKNINAMRVQAIENYDLSLGMLVNPNIKQQLVLNPIGVSVALTTLKELREELENYEIKLNEIDCNRIFYSTESLTETEVFIRSINSYLNYRNDYTRIIQTKELDRDFPREQRKKIADGLEKEIKGEYKKIETVGKINKNLRRASEARVEALGVELRDILSTLEAPTEEYINNMLYIIAESKIKEIKSRLDSKIAYLGSVMEDIA